MATRFKGANEVMNFEYKKKFLVLKANEGHLLRRYREHSKPHMRMKGITQSYYMYDSDLYRKAKPMIEKIKLEKR